MSRRWTWISVGIASAVLLINLIKNAFIESILPGFEKKATNPKSTATDRSSPAAAGSR
ncbi:MAG: hypothetical protein LUO89_15155 [Methanothrix sp.]|nr:hypothetical protein [Methanothrix sp.]